MPAVRRTTTGRHRGRRTLVETRHSSGDWLIRGWIRPVGVQDMTGAGLAGHVVWHLMDHDSTLLDPVIGDYMIAEKALLEATKELES